MTAAVDTNILLDILLDQPEHRAQSEEALQAAGERGALIIAEPVFAELAPIFAAEGQMREFLDDVSVRLAPSPAASLHRAGVSWQAYVKRRPRSVTCPECGAAQQVRCRRCGHGLFPRQHLIADFIIGAHALELAGELITRDRGFYRTYFPELHLL